MLGQPDHLPPGVSGRLLTRDQAVSAEASHDPAQISSVEIQQTPAFELGDEWLGRFVAHLQRRRDQAVARLAAIPGVRCAVPEGTFVAFPDVSSMGVDADELAGWLLERHNVAVVPGSGAFFGPGAAGHLRLSFATSRGILAEGLDRIAAGLRSARAEREVIAAVRGAWIPRAS